MDRVPGMVLAHVIIKQKYTQQLCTAWYCAEAREKIVCMCYVLYTTRKYNNITKEESSNHNCGKIDRIHVLCFAFRQLCLTSRLIEIYE